MPMYEYGCIECGLEFEEFQKITAEPLKVCPTCAGEVERLISKTSFVLKGRGWPGKDLTNLEANRRFEETGVDQWADHDDCDPGGV